MSQLGPILKVVGTRWRELLIVALMVIVVYQNISNTRWVFWADTIPYLQAEIVDAELKVDLALQANSTLRESIEKTNDQITGWRILSKSLEKQSDLLQMDLIVARINTDTTVREVIREDTPTSCSAAFEYLRDAIPELNYTDDLIDGDLFE